MKRFVVWEFSLFVTNKKKEFLSAHNRGQGCSRKLKLLRQKKKAEFEKNPKVGQNKPKFIFGVLSFGVPFPFAFLFFFLSSVPLFHFSSLLLSFLFLFLFLFLSKFPSFASPLFISVSLLLVSLYLLFFCFLSFFLVWKNGFNFLLLFIGRGGSRGGCTRFLIGGSHQSGLLVGCLFFVLFLFSVFCGSVSCDDSFCVEYSLQNEMYLCFGNCINEQGEQEDFFNENVSLTISDVRMRPEKCRKPFLLYYCQLMFGGFVCQSSSREEQLCFEQETCRQVAEACSDEFSLDCLPSSFPTSTPTTSFRQSICNEICDVEVEEQIEQAKENIIRVETCLDGSKEQIECCNDPFIFDDNDECVIECPQYLVGQSLEKWVGLTDFVFNWLFLIALIAAIPPLYFMANIRFFYLSFWKKEWVKIIKLLLKENIQTCKMTMKNNKNRYPKQCSSFCIWGIHSCWNGLYECSFWWFLFLQSDSWVSFVVERKLLFFNTKILKRFFHRSLQIYL